MHCFPWNSRILLRQFRRRSFSDPPMLIESAPDNAYSSAVNGARFSHFDFVVPWSAVPPFAILALPQSSCRIYIFMAKFRSYSVKRRRIALNLSAIMSRCKLLLPQRPEIPHALPRRLIPTAEYPLSGTWDEVFDSLSVFAGIGSFGPDLSQLVSNPGAALPPPSIWLLYAA